MTLSATHPTPGFRSSTSRVPHPSPNMRPHIVGRRFSSLSTSSSSRDSVFSSSTTRSSVRTIDEMRPRAMRYDSSSTKLDCADEPSPSSYHLEPGRRVRESRRTDIGSLSSSLKTECRIDDGSTASTRSATSLPREQNRDRGVCIVGLDNLGNTCFMNAALQCLMSIPLLTDLFVTDRYQMSLNPSSPTKGRMAEAFANLLAEARPIRRDQKEMSNSSISPREIKRLVAKYADHFDEYMQHDCQEFLRYFVDALSEDLRVVKSNSIQSALTDKEYAALPPLRQSKYMWKRHLYANGSDIQKAFGGQLESKILCSACGGISRTFDPVVDVSLPLPMEESGSSTSSSSDLSPCRPAGVGVTLYDCLSEFVREEELGDVRCDRCRRRTRCSKSLRFMRRPSHLVLHLKRFRYTEYAREKIKTAVSYPVRDLNLQPFMSEESSHGNDATYSLLAVVHHTGNLSGGHYTAVCRSQCDWYNLNDEDVVKHDSRVDQKIGAPSVSAYVLIYELQSEGY